MCKRFIRRKSRRRQAESSDQICGKREGGKEEGSSRKSLGILRISDKRSARPIESLCANIICLEFCILSEWAYLRSNPMLSDWLKAVIGGTTSTGIWLQIQMSSTWYSLSIVFPQQKIWVVHFHGQYTIPHKKEPNIFGKRPIPGMGNEGRK